MLKKYYLHNNGLFVRKFVIRANSSSELTSSIAHIKDVATAFDGKLLYEKQLSPMTEFIILSFKDATLMVSWECVLNSSVNLVEIVSSKILVVKNENDSQSVQQTVKNILEQLPSYKGAMLTSKKISDNEIHLFLFFTDLKEMARWTSEKGITE